MAKPRFIELPDGTRVDVVFEDRSVLLLDKPPGRLVAPEDWDQTARNLTRALAAGIHAGDWWAQSRNLRSLRFVHRLDAETSGLLMAVKNDGAVAAYSRLFAGRAIEKRYLAVVEGNPPAEQWKRQDPLGPEPGRPERHRVDRRTGRPASTEFRVLARREGTALVEARPHTGRTHQIRLHLQASGCPVVGDNLYGRPDPRGLALRAVGLKYADPFRQRPVRVAAPVEAFCRRYGFDPGAASDREAPRPFTGVARRPETIRPPSVRSAPPAPSAAETRPPS